MVLSSQMSRAGNGRQYMASRRRRRHWRRWVVLAALLAAGWWFYGSSFRSTSTDEPEAASTPQAAAMVNKEPTPLAQQADKRLDRNNADAEVSPQEIPAVTVVAVTPAAEPPEPAVYEDIGPKQTYDDDPIVEEQTPQRRDTNQPNPVLEDPPPTSPSAIVEPIIAQSGSSLPNLSSTVEIPTSPVTVAAEKQPQEQSAADEPTPTPPALRDPRHEPKAEPLTPAKWTGDVETTSLSKPISQGLLLIEQGDPVAGRRVLSELLIGYESELSDADAQAIRETLSQVNASLIFSPKVHPGDIVTEYYTIKHGDLLSRVAPKYNITYHLIETINGISARRIRSGQQVKVIHGPFHAVVDKSDYRMDLYLPEPDGGMIYIRSFTVGLGENDSTPLGSWSVRRGGKLVNPGWTNPRTGKLYDPDDPQNPIGDYWIALSGADEHTKGLQGYGIHGTIEPESIGRSASMGCVRMSDKDIELVYKLLFEGLSTVIIRP